MIEIFGTEITEKDCIDELNRIGMGHFPPAEGLPIAIAELLEAGGSDADWERTGASIRLVRTSLTAAECAEIETALTNAGYDPRNFF